MHTRKSNQKSILKRNDFTRRHNIEMSACPDKDVPCDTMDTKLDGAINPTWMTCITKRGVKYHIKYVTPANMFVKSIESAQIPHFNVVAPDGASVMECKLKIENKFVSCFLKICGEWYAIMRLLGKTINTGVLAMTVRNRAYYRLDTKYIDIDEKTGLVKFAKDAIEKTENGWYILMTKKTPGLILGNKVWEPVDRAHNGEVFRVLNTFRIQKLIGNSMKYYAMGEAASVIA
jgi:hypothetical protein